MAGPNGEVKSTLAVEHLRRVTLPGRVVADEATLARARPRARAPRSAPQRRLRHDRRHRQGGQRAARPPPRRRADRRQRQRVLRRSVGAARRRRQTHHADALAGPAADRPRRDRPSPGRAQPRRARRPARHLHRARGLAAGPAGRPGRQLSTRSPSRSPATTWMRCSTTPTRSTAASPTRSSACARRSSSAGSRWVSPGRTAPCSGFEQRSATCWRWPGARPLHGAAVGSLSVLAAMLWARVRTVANAGGLRALRFPTAAEMEPRVHAAFAALDPSGRAGDECWRGYSVKLERWHAARDELTTLWERGRTPSSTTCWLRRNGWSQRCARPARPCG